MDHRFEAPCAVRPPGWPLQWVHRMLEASSGSESATVAVVAGTSWTALSRAGQVLFTLVSLSVMARFVPPRAYGLVGMAQVVLGLADRKSTRLNSSHLGISYAV